MQSVSQALEEKKKKLFTPSEDMKLMELNKYFPKDWQKISSFMAGRTSRQCRERYCTYLNPGVNRTEWTDYEDRLLENLVAQHGTNWTYLTTFFHGRTSNSIKNRYYVHIIHRPRKPKQTHQFPNVLTNFNIPQKSTQLDIINNTDLFNDASLFQSFLEQDEFSKEIEMKFTNEQEFSFGC
jgi:hypothetical protein